MKIGLDLDHTITEMPEFFALITRALVESGHAVHVISFREPGTRRRVIAELDARDVRYTHVHLPSVGGTEAAHEWKGHLAEELGLDLMIDDSPEVLERMPPGVKRLWLCDPEVFNLELCLKALRSE